MSSRPEQNSTPFTVFQDANSQKVFWGQLISQSCDKLMSVGMIWVITSEFSPKWVPWFIAIGALPHFLLATRSGHLLARFGSLPTIIWADFLRAALFLAAAAFVPVIASNQNLLNLLMFLALVSNIFGAVFNPAILSLPLSMMEAGENRDKLTALIDSCFSWGNVLGPLVSALAYAWVGLAGMLAINGASYLFAALLALSVKLPALNLSLGEAASAATDSGEHASARTIGQVIKSQPVISGMLLTFLFMNFFLAPLMIFMPWYAKNVYADGISALAKLEFALGVGTVAGGMLLSFWKLPGSTWIRVSGALLLMASAYLAFTYSQSLFAGCIAVLFLGFFLSLANVVCLTFFQSTPEMQDVPTVMGMVNLISVASLPVSMGILGSFIERVPVETFAAVCAAVVMVIALAIPLIPGIKGVK